MVVVDLGIGVVVAMNEENFGRAEDRFQFYVQRAPGLDVAEQDDGSGSVAFYAPNNKVEVAMRVAEENNFGTSQNK